MFESFMFILEGTVDLLTIALAIYAAYSLWKFHEARKDLEKALEDLQYVLYEGQIAGAQEVMRMVLAALDDPAYYRGKGGSDNG